MDAWNGYHSIPLAEEDRHLTTFLTPWGRLRYRVLPQGYLAAGDAYTHRYDQVTRDFPHPFTRCVDDCLPWTNSIEDMFFVVCEYLTLTGKHGIIQSPSKFVFCQKELEFVGFWLGEDSIKPSPETLKAITEFPRPTNITDIRSFFGLVEQVSFAFSKTAVMAPFRELLSPKSEFAWTAELQVAFEEAKKVIVK